MSVEIGSSPDTPLGLLAALRPESQRLRKAMTGYALGATALAGARRAQKWWRDRYEYSVSIRSTEDIYLDVRERLLAMIPERNRRALLAAALRGRRRLRAGELEVIEPMGAPRETTRLATFYDGDTPQTFTLEGHKISVSVHRESMDFDADRMGGDRFHRNERLKFICHSEDARGAVVRWLESIVAERDDEPAPRFYLTNRWGGSWERRDDLRPRALDTVILRDGQMERIVADLELFLSVKDDYLHHGIPYHRGYLFHGPPGTGKTSLAQALAAHFGLDMFYAPLADLDKDANLLHLVSLVQPNSVLLLEDVDVFHAATERNDDAEGISLSGLLNALDGVSTPSGIITIMTTNDLTALDGALVRPGRVDRQEEIGYLVTEQLERLVTMVVGEPIRYPDVPDIGRGLALSPADVMEVFKRHLHEPKLALDPLREMIEGKRPR